MTRLVRAELLKARSTRTGWVLAAAAIVFCASWAVLQVVVFPNAETSASLPVDEQVRSAYGMAQQGYLFVLILGILAMAGEYRHQTTTWAFLVSPRRGRFVAAKLLTYAVIGLVISLACAVATVTVAASLLGATGMPITAPGVPLVLLGSVVSTTLYGVLGVGIGALVRSQAAAIALACVWFFYAEFMLVYYLPEVGRWVPTGAAKALTGFQLRAQSELLPAWGGGLLFLGYALALAVAGYLVTVRRDVT